MLNHRLIIATAAALCMGTVAEAQRPLTLSLAGGGSLPVGRFGDVASTGWHALVGIGLSTLMQPIGLRLDVAHNRFTAEAAGPDQAVTSGTLNFTYRLPMTNSPMSPYLISGLGAYRSECSLDTGCEATTRYGWNVGLGTKLYVLGFRSFLEARYHRTEIGDTGVQYFTPTFGLLF